MLVKSGNESQISPLITAWSLSNDQGDQWKLGQFPLKSQDLFPSYTVLIEGHLYNNKKIKKYNWAYLLFQELNKKKTGIVGSDTATYISIDQLEITSSVANCPVLPGIATPSNRSLSCTFESGLCGWYSDVSDKKFEKVTFTWTRAQPMPERINPFTDRTTNSSNGWFMLSC